MKTSILTCLGLLPVVQPLMAQSTSDSERPNIVWFLTEDVSSHYLALFNEGHGALTPNVERLAQHGIIFSNAYSCAPVSSAARTTLITGCYAPSFEGSFHRALNSKKVSDMPADLHMFPAYLRQAGYYTCNALKTDYNVKLDQTAWNEISGSVASWKKHIQKNNQPFFLMRTSMTTHEGKLHFNADDYQTQNTSFNPDSVHLHPSLPDTRLMRYTYATFYDRINDADHELGDIVKILEQEGKMDNTFIFYFGDNGGSLPGTKGYTQDIGFHVPLVVYVPEKWKDRVTQPYGSTEEGLVSFMDFAPTVLHLAGVEVPQGMDGMPFLGNDIALDNRTIYGYGDRYDEFYAFNRCIREGRYRYVRNYMPHHCRSLFTYFRYKQLAFREWKEMSVDGKLNDNQQRFFEKMGPEELYDLEADPYELHNLANDPAHREVLNRLHDKLNTYMTDKADLGFFPETVVLEEALPKMDQFGQMNKERIARFIHIADLQTMSFNSAVEKELHEALKSTDPVERWWGLITCAYFGNETKGLKDEIVKLIDDNQAFVSSKAMVSASILGNRYDRKHFMTILNKARVLPEVLLVLNDLAYMYDEELITPFWINSKDVHVQNQFVTWRLSYLNACSSTDEVHARWKNIYKERTVHPKQPVVPEGSVFFESFINGQGDFTIDNQSALEMATPVWYPVNSNGYACMRANAFAEGKNYESESWLISPEIDLNHISAAELSFDNAANFFSSDEDFCVKVKATDDEMWQDLNLDYKALGKGWGNITTRGDLKGYDGKTIQLAFVYRSSSTDVGTWDVRNVCVSGNLSSGIGVLKCPVQSGILYDISGRRIFGDPHGLYIVNGKKCFVNR